MPRTYYDILGIDQTADTKSIRRAYLQLSLQYHPDKNPDNIEEAKSKFIEIGQAHDTLIDPIKRSIYDKELKEDNGHTNRDKINGSSGIDEKLFYKFRDRFDSHMAGMSESDLASIIGKVSAVAGMVGGAVGSIVMRQKANNAGTSTSSAAGGMIGKAGSLMGSMVSSDFAANGVKVLHQRAVERINYKEECIRALERGDPAPPPPASAGDTDWKEIFEQVKNGMLSGNNNSSDESGARQQQQQHEQQGIGSKIGNLWNKVAPVVVAVAAARAANSNSSQNNCEN